MLSISSNFTSRAVILLSSEASEAEEDDDAPADAIQGFDEGSKEGRGLEEDTLRRLSTAPASFSHSTAEPTSSPALANSAINMPLLAGPKSRYGS